MKLSHIRTEKGVFKFTLAGVDTSVANALRRTIISDIPVCGINADSKLAGDCVVNANTSRLHNEILKHRLTCIPVMVELADIDEFCDKYELAIDVENDTDDTIFVTTEQFVVREKNSKQPLPREEIAKIFPPDELTNYYIDFARLRPRLGDTIPGEKLNIVCTFARHSAHENGVYNAVCICTYANTPDPTAITERWREIEAEKVAAEMSAAEIENERKDFLALDAQRCFVPHSFDFSIKSVCAHDNIEIVRIACDVLIQHYNDFAAKIDAGEVPINPSTTTMMNSFDVTLNGEDHTTGKPLELALYDALYVKSTVLSYCGFKKFHPHDVFSIIRLAFTEPTSPAVAATHLKTAAVACSTIFSELHDLFK